MKPWTHRVREICPIDRLKPHPKNPREHPEGQIAQLMGSLTERGFTHTILADENGNVLTGHGLLEAARRHGLEEVAVTIIDNLTEAEKDAYLIADNQLGLNSSWDEEKLSALVIEIEKQHADLAQTGLSPQELDRLLADLAPEQDFIDEDAVPEISRIPATIPGDLWILGKHLLFCGDSTSEETLQQLLKGETAAMAIVDFPYNTNYRQRRRANQPALRIANDDLEEEQFEQFLYSACVQILAGTHGAVYLFMSSNHLHTLFKAFTGAGGHWSTFLVWAKDRFALGRSDYQRMFELILYGWKEGNPHFWCGARDEGDLWFVPKPKANRLHPTMKPVSLIERAIRNSSQRGDLVLDLFGGGGVDPDRL